MTSAETRKSLVDVALGRAAPDLVLRGGVLANVMTRELYPAEIAIKAGRIAAVVAPGSADWGRCDVLDVTGCVVAPGFIDPHVHIESSMVSVTEYARAAISHGVTCVAADPHEIGNVLGIRGMELLLEEARQVPLDVLLRVPGRIPAMPDWLETSNGRLDLEATRAMLDWPEAVCLAGDINPALLLRNDPEQAEKIAMVAARNRTVSGQSPGLSGRTLCGFIAAGPEDSHVAGSVAEILEDQRLGLRSVIALRPGRRLDSSHLRELARLIAERGIETRFLQFCTDDIHAHELVSEGHLDHRLRTAIAAGIEPMLALQMATLNVAEGLRIDRDRGAVVPGKRADLVILSDLVAVAIDKVMIGGKIVFADGDYRGPRQPYSFPAWARQTIRIAEPVTPDDLTIRVPQDAGRARIRAISATTPKEEQELVLAVRDGAIEPDPGQNVSALAVIERHNASGRIGKGFVTGLSLRRGAIATTVSHDAHNLVVVGADYGDMAAAANRVIENGGGYAVALDGKNVFNLPLPIAGLYSDAPLEVIAEKTKQLEALLLGELGCTLGTRPLMSLNFLCLPNIPNFGFTDRGMVGTRDLALVDGVLAVEPAEDQASLS
jgi:adenine deaminase